MVWTPLTLRPLGLTGLRKSSRSKAVAEDRPAGRHREGAETGPDHGDPDLATAVGQMNHVHMSTQAIFAATAPTARGELDLLRSMAESTAGSAPLTAAFVQAS
jgi:hypothetical protein